MDFKRVSQSASGKKSAFPSSSHEIDLTTSHDPHPQEAISEKFVQKLVVRHDKENSTLRRKMKASFGGFFRT